MEKNNKIRKIITNLIIFILLIILTFYLVLKDQDFSQMSSILKTVKKEFILLGILAMCIYVSCEAINIRRILKELEEKVSFFSAIKYTLSGFFFSAITPAASGGQPMEIYYMHKDNISVAHSTLTLLMQLCSFQIISISFGIISAIIHFDVLKNGLIYLFILGIALNSSALALLVIAIFSKRLSEGLIKFSVKVLKFFRIRNIEEKQEKLEKELASYQTSAIYIKEHKLLMVKTLLTTAVQLLAYYSVTYWVYLAFGLNTYNIWQILTLQAVLYATVSGIPSPGAVGVSEGGFLGIFRKAFPEATISSAMLLSRGVNFYLLIIVSVIVVIVNTFREKKVAKQ
ncbi:MAG: YbhN family protein [Clostridia bacterium]